MYQSSIFQHITFAFVTRLEKLHCKKIDEYLDMPVPVATQSKASVCGRSPAEIVGSNPIGGMDVCLL